MEWENRSHFYGIAARLMGQILIQQARVRHAIKRGGGNAIRSLDEAALIAQEPSRSMMELCEALADLIEEDPRKGQIVELRYLWGMTTEEIAQQLGVSASTVEREMRMALPWLRRRIEGGGRHTQ
jgi:RNA polymerase sigma factor (TIGR02999 family)